MAKSVTTGGFAQASGADCKLDRVLEVLFRDVMAAALAATRVNSEFCGGENVLPRPRTCSIDVFSVKGVRQINRTAAAGKILAMQFADACKILLESSF